MARICIAAGLLAACSGEDVQQKTVSTPQPAVCNGPTVEISGADPQYETPNATANQDYERDGKSYKIVQDPSNFTQAGFAAIYDAEPNSNLTASGRLLIPRSLQQPIQRCPFQATRGSPTWRTAA